MTASTPHSQGPLLRIYRSVSPALCSMVQIAAPFSTKLAAGVSGRNGLWDRLATSASSVRGGIWFHSTSVGEYEQARPVIAALKKDAACPPVIVTHFSPSGYDFALKRPCGDLHEYLPFDHPDDMEKLVLLWQPRALIFVKFDCWPNQVIAAEKHGVPVVLLAGSLQPDSARLKGLGRQLFRDVFNRFSHVGVCTPEDKKRFKEGMGITSPVSVTGDTRVEQVILRYEAAEDGATASRLKSLGGRLLILGSTWPPDEKLWLPILKELLESQPDLRVVLTPHEPRPHRLVSLQKNLTGQNIPTVLLSNLMATENGPHNARIILVDSIGVLAEIYRAGHLAYVGGSFTTGVHNTMEPAIGKMPVMFGPVIKNAEEAGMLVDEGAGFVLREPAQALAKASQLLGDTHLLHDLGRKAQDVVLAQRGATERSLKVLKPLLNL
jgi:3-deoxy-D-manno-octulosonic-acid transferase